MAGCTNAIRKRKVERKKKRKEKKGLVIVGNSVGTNGCEPITIMFGIDGPF